MIDLTSFKCSALTTSLMTAGVLQKPAFGTGIIQRISRMGDRFMVEFQTPTMEMEKDGRRAIALLQQAQRQGGRVLYSQPGLRIGATKAPLVNGAHAAGTSLAIKGLPAAYPVRMGQALNVIVAGRYYLYFSAVDAVASAAGNVSITLTSPMRSLLVGNEVINLARPVIEGWLDGNTRDWTVDVAHTTGLTFSVMERA